MTKSVHLLRAGPSASSHFWPSYLWLSHVSTSCSGTCWHRFRCQLVTKLDSSYDATLYYFSSPWPGCPLIHSNLNPLEIEIRGMSPSCQHSRIPAPLYSATASLSYTHTWLLPTSKSHCHCSGMIIPRSVRYVTRSQTSSFYLVFCELLLYARHWV